MSTDTLAWLGVYTLAVGLMGVLVVIADKWYYDTRKRNVWKSDKRIK